MRKFIDLNFTKHFRQLPSSLYSDVQPQGLLKPKLVCASESTAALLNLDVNDLKTEQVISVISGNSVRSDWQPLAMKYTGHQFGYYNPDLGDGRGLLLAEVKNNLGEIWDLHLKGAGLTPYSRQGDGRAVLRSSIREFLCSEALASLNIPTSRALCIVDSETPVYRETPESGAALIRVAKSHIRFGHFEFCSFTEQLDLLKNLCDYVINRHYANHQEIQNTDTPYSAFFRITAEKTADLMVQWQAIGFAHGVMNTDNMSIIGDTFDFGPFAFMDDYESDFICNHSDHQGRYAFNQQPGIAHWNLSVLAQALLPLVDKEDLIETLNSFSTRYQKSFSSLFLKKLGLQTRQPNDDTLIQKTLEVLAYGHMDYTHFFRKLSDINNPEIAKHLRNHCTDLEKFDQWKTLYFNRLELETDSENQRKEQMNAVNPKYILRNYLAQNAISAAQSGDYSEVQTLFSLLQKPFDEQPEFESYADLPPEWGKKLEISCSS